MKRMLQKDFSLPTKWFYKSYVVMNQRNVIKYALVKVTTMSMCLANCALQTVNILKSNYINVLNKVY